MVTWLFYKFHTLWFYHRIYQSLQRLVLYTDSYYTGIYNAYDTLTDGTLISQAAKREYRQYFIINLYYEFGVLKYHSESQNWCAHFLDSDTVRAPCHTG
jgi:hypothetical protein